MSEKPTPLPTVFVVLDSLIEEEKIDLPTACQALYEATGQSTVQEFVDWFDPEARGFNAYFAWCEGCDTLNPTIDNACLVCGTTLEEEK